MRVQVLQHVPFEGLGSMADWFERRGDEVHYTRFFESAEPPDPGAVDMVVAMGGPMSVNDEDEYPWLKPEKRFIRECVERGLPVLGICLGAQAIASALGAKVYPNDYKEIGWFPVEATGNGADHFAFSGEPTVFHWHGETFELPPGAAHIARSAACENQGFQLGDNVIGLQFHLETTPESAGLLIDHCRDELNGGDFVQSEATMRAAPASAYAAINGLMEDVLCYLVSSDG